MFETPSRGRKDSLAVELVEDFIDRGIFCSIENTDPFPAVQNQAGPLQNRQVAGDVGLLPADGREDLADTAFPIPQVFNNSQAGGLAQGLQDLGFLFEIHRENFIIFCPAPHQFFFISLDPPPFPLPLGERVEDCP